MGDIVSKSSIFANKNSPEIRGNFLLQFTEFFLDFFEIRLGVAVIRALFEIVLQVCLCPLECMAFSDLLSFTLFLFCTAFLIFFEVNTIREMTSISRKCGSLVVGKHCIPEIPWAPPFTEIGSWCIVRMLVHKSLVTLIVIEVFLECMDFTIYIRAGDDTSVECHREKWLKDRRFLARYRG